MVNFTVGYGAQYRTNHAVTSLHRAVRLVSPAVHAHARAHTRTIEPCDCTRTMVVARPVTGVGARTHLRAPPTRTHNPSPSRNRRGGSIRDEAIDFEMLDFVSISSIVSLRLTEETTTLGPDTCLNYGAN